MVGPTPADLDQSRPGWYLDLMAPNEKGPPFAWVDPSRIYLFPESLQACVDDLVRPFLGGSDSVDLVAGIDAMGFVLGTALAQRFGKGFLTIRKVGHMCVKTDTQSYTDYQNITKTMEVRTDPFPKGTRVLVVDQWVETGGTMEGALRLVEAHGGIVAGFAAVCIEETPGGKSLKSRWKHSHCTPPVLQEQVNAKCLDSFKMFK